MTGAERKAALTAAYARPGFNVPKLKRWLRKALTLWGCCLAALALAYGLFIRARPAALAPVYVHASCKPDAFGRCDNVTAGR